MILPLPELQLNFIKVLIVTIIHMIWEFNTLSIALFFLFHIYIYILHLSIQIWIRFIALTHDNCTHCISDRRNISQYGMDVFMGKTFQTIFPKNTGLKNKILRMIKHIILNLTNTHFKKKINVFCYSPQSSTHAGNWNSTTLRLKKVEFSLRPITHRHQCLESKGEKVNTRRCISIRPLEILCLYLERLGRNRSCWIVSLDDDFSRRRKIERFFVCLFGCVSSESEYHSFIL